MGICAIGQSCAPVRNHARRLDPLARGFITGRMRIFRCDSDALCCPTQLHQAFPRRLRSPSLDSRRTASSVQHKISCAPTDQGRDIELSIAFMSVVERTRRDC